MDLSTKISDLNLNYPIFNASGPKCTYFLELEALNNINQTGAIITKSCTLNIRDGNVTPRYYYDSLNKNSINSTGLANMGYKYYFETSLQLEKMKPYILSVAGLSLDENKHIFNELNNQKHDIDYVELNLSCPNIIGKPQTGYDFETSRETIRILSEIYDKPFGLKLPPYFDNSHFNSMTNIINDYSNIHSITCVNSLGNGLFIDSENEQTTIKPNHGCGGVGGNCIKPFALSNVHNFYIRLNDRVDIIGCGGINTGEDIFEHILCGAKAVQIGTAYQEEGVEIFGRLLNELTLIMKNKGYNKIDDFRGKLKYL